MKAAQLLALAATTTTLVGAASTVHANPDSYNPDAFDLAVLDREVAPARGGIELTVGGGYAQGGGNAGGGLAHVDDMAGAGGAATLELGVRVAPHVAVGAYGTATRFSSGSALADDTRVFGASAGLEVTLHARPDRAIDPWLSVGAGWRGLWLDPSQGGRTSLQGVELARVQVGVDYRVSRGVAIAPVIGASADMFLAADAADAPMSLGSKEVHYYVFSGIAGRFGM